MSKTQKEAAWEKAKEINGVHPNVKREDCRGKKIVKSAYGDRNSNFGWDIHHIDGNNSNNNLDNLKAVHHNTHTQINQ